MGLIVFVIPISNVVAPPPPAAERPVWFNTLHGTLVSGDLDDLQNFYDDAVHWEGKLYYMGNPFLGFSWIVQPALYFDDPGYTYEYVFLTVRFKYSGNSDLRIIVFYYGGTFDEFLEPSTGGSYVMKFYMLYKHKTVSYICFYSAQPSYYGQQHVYIDCAEVGYASVW